jgi:HAE1 family hydrophobic/amphiphilic exporter-1
MKELSGAIIAITLVMIAVFVPVAFMSGPSGVFYRQFSLTMAFSIMLSGIVALTLSPAICAILLKNPHLKERKNTFINRFFDGFNNWYNNLSLKYQNLLKLIANRRIVTFGTLILFCIGSGIFMKILPSGFIPNEDQGTFYVSVTTPAGSTLERTNKIVNQVQKACVGINAIESVASAAGTDILSDGTGPTYGTLIVNLKEWSKRKESVNDIIELLKKKTEYINGAKLEFFPPPTVPGYGNASGFEMRLLDKTGSGDFQKMQTVVTNFINDLKARPEIKSAFTIYDATYPQYMLHIDTDKAAQKGVTVNNVMGTLQTMLGSDFATNFIRFGKTYRVMVQALPEYRAKPEDILKLYVKNNNQEMIPLSTFMTLEKVYGVDYITRYNSYTSAEMNGEAADGYSNGDVIKAIKEIAKEKLPKGYDIGWAGITLDEVSIGSEPIIIFLICLIFVYLLLSAQYESFMLPMPVILFLPTGIFGALLLLKLLGLEYNIYAQVAMIMLIGLLGKNAILIVEYASIKHHEGRTPFQAAIEAAKIRLRPILMTSFAFMAGLIPLVFASGAGAVGNKTIGAAAVGGMLFGTLFGVIIIPGLYIVFATIDEKYNHNKYNEDKPLTESKK